MTLQSFESLPKEGERYGDVWALINDSSTIQALRARLAELRSLSPSEADMSLSENGTLMTGLKDFWIRASSDPDFWPGIHSHQWYNFGPTNHRDGRGEIRINRRLWDLLIAADVNAPWKGTNRGFVPLRASDPILAAARDRLRTLGYIDGGVGVSVQDSSAFVNALKAYWGELGNSGTDAGPWPDGFNFGPNDGANLRVSPKLLHSLVNTQDNPRRLIAVAGFTSGLQGMRSKPPIIGSVGASVPSTTLRRLSPPLQLSLSAGLDPAGLSKIRSSLLLPKR